MAIVMSVERSPIEDVALTATISTQGLTKHYGKNPALEALDLDVPTGAVFGYLGPNGAGKTTTIRLLMGLLRPTAGSSQVLGLDTLTQRQEVQRRVGYLPGDFVGYKNLTGAEYLRLLLDLRRHDDQTLMLALCDRLDLPLDRHIGDLSHGNRQKVGLIQAFMHEPEVLILDEPTSGLDPLVQQEFLAMIREAKEAARTVFLSSHILAEVEAVADTVAILRRGHLILTERLETLKQRATHRIEIEFATPVASETVMTAPGVRDVLMDGRTALITVEGSAAGVFRLLGPLGIERVRTHEADLEDIFLSHYQEA